MIDTDLNIDYTEACGKFCDLQDRFLSCDAVIIKVPLLSQHTRYMNTSNGPSSQPSVAVFEWLEDQGLRHGHWRPGFWTDNWPQIEDAEQRVVITFSIVDHQIALLCKLTFGDSL